MAQIIPIRSAPGIQRDGTKFDRDHYTDGQWCRFQRGLPRKIGGYREVSGALAEIVYGIHSFTSNATQYLHLGSDSLLGQRLIDNDGMQTAFNDRTPAGFVASSLNIWQFDAIFDVDANDTILVAHGAQNMDLSSSDEQPVWYGAVTAATPLINTTYSPVSGGVVTVGNYLVAYGSGGYVQWNSTPNNIDAGTDEDFITQQKIVKGLVARGGGVPAALLWSLDTLLLMSLNAGGTPIWDFDTIGEISVLSSRGIIEYDGVYYWPGVDRFLAYNGVIREIPNQFNVNFFFDNLNFEWRQKVFAFKVPRFGEIWWLFPSGDSIECNHAVIFNVREGYWYDTEIPNMGRSDGIYAKVYFKPFMTGVELGGAGYSLWQHETGVDEDVGGNLEPIQSYFETAEISLVSAEQPQSATLSVQRIESDFIQTGDLTLTVKGRANARAQEISSDPITITEQEDPSVGVVAAEQITNMKESRRLLSFKFESNEPEGDYQMGHVVAHVDQNDQRITQ
jgi:hypothetical protein